MQDVMPPSTSLEMLLNDSSAPDEQIETLIIGMTVHITAIKARAIKTTDGEYKMIKLDRSVVTDPDNAVERFIADFRNQTNITWESSSQIISKLK